MKILLIDNHVLFREGLRYVLQQLPGSVDEILEAGNFPDALLLAGQHPGLGLVLLELKTPGSDGAMSIKLFRQHYPRIPLVVVSSEEDYLVINKALGYGANGFVHKSSGVMTLLDTLNLALSENIYVRPQLLRQFGRAWNKNNRNGIRGPNANEYGLTMRQMEVLKYLSEGLSNKEIAGVINLSEGTVKTHVSAIYQALHVNNRMDAMRVVKQLGLGGTPHSVINSESGKLPVNKVAIFNVGHATLRPTCAPAAQHINTDRQTKNSGHVLRTFN